ncbi:DUF952 domain-containing protein [Spongisporangium articulatum]|uniref:DUF952 domain-containing protein n=1 Tax=Spongisporangium articulatum TaxID=3362603 RepID=A0ABW8ATF6_9ACTN
MADGSGRVLHVAETAQWELGRQVGSYEISSRGKTLAEEGFIHCSTATQAGPVLRNFYADLDPAALTLLVLDVDLLGALGSPVRWDDVPGAEAPFPHVYGPILPGAVVATLAVGGTAGAPELPPPADLDALDVLSAPPSPSE